MTATTFLARSIASLALAVISAGASGKTIEYAIQAGTGIESWQLIDEGFDVMLMQITPDQSRGFFLGRGFTREDADHYAESCVLAAIVKNHTKKNIAYNLADWRYTDGKDGLKHKIRLRGDWLEIWKQRGVSKSSRIAFEWSQHPDKQLLEPGDWNQGMTTYQVPHGSTLNLIVNWKIGEHIREETIPGIRCAK